MKTNLTIALLDDLESELNGNETDVAQAIADDINKQVDHSQRTMFRFMSDLYGDRLLGANLLNVIRFWLMASQDDSFEDLTIHNGAKQSFRLTPLEKNKNGIHEPRKIKFIIYRRFFSAKWLRFLREVEHSEILPTPVEVKEKIME